MLISDYKCNECKCLNQEVFDAQSFFNTSFLSVSRGHWRKGIPLWQEGQAVATGPIQTRRAEEHTFTFRHLIIPWILFSTRPAIFTTPFQADVWWLFSRTYLFFCSLFLHYIFFFRITIRIEMQPWRRLIFGLSSFLLASKSLIEKYEPHLR